MALLPDRADALQATHAATSTARKLLSIREPVWRVSLRTLYDGDAPVPLVMNHLAKCGGSFVKDVLWQAVPGPSLRVEDESVSLTRKDVGGRNFIIGLIRNPFDYYVSLWAFTSYPSTCCFKKALSREQRQDCLGQDRPFGKTADDRARFRRWLRAVSTEELGVLTMRFYASYYRSSQPRGTQDVPDRWQTMTANRPTVNVTNINQALASFGADTGPVSCWVHTEDLAEDLRRCLVRYESAAGVAGVVDWVAFNRSVATSDQNDADHVACDDFFDEASSEFVRHSDRHIFRAFGYPERCHRPGAGPWG